MAKSKVEYKPSLGSVLTLGAELVSSRVTCTGGDRGVCVCVMGSYGDPHLLRVQTTGSANRLSVLPV